MKLETIILDASKAFLTTRFLDYEKTKTLKLEPVENLFGLFPKNTKSSFKLLGTYIDKSANEVYFEFFVKVSAKNEVLACKLVSLRARSIIPEIYAYYSLDNSDNLFLVFTQYIENSKSLWYLLNSLKVRSGTLQEHHAYAGGLLKVIASKLAALHYLLSVEWLKQNKQYLCFKVLQNEEIMETIAKGIAFLQRDFSRYNFLSFKSACDLASSLEKHKNFICRALCEYPYQGIVHGDMQIPNIIWQPQDENRNSFYFVDWNYAFIGPQILDLYSFTIDDPEDIFLKSYLRVSSELYQRSLDVKDMTYYLAHAIIYQSLRLASQSADLLDDYDSHNGGFAAGIVETLLTRIMAYIQKIEVM